MATADNFTWMHSAQPGAKQMNGLGGYNTNNDMLLMLDSVLVDGFNERTVVSLNYTGGVATLTYENSHGYEPLQRISITGADDESINGTHRIASTTLKTVSINLLGVSLTTGTIVTKIAPLGWESIFGNADPMKRAYRSKNPETTQSVLYLNMSHPTTNSGYNSTYPVKRAMLSVCEDMTTLGVQINSYTNDLNDYANNPNGSLFWYQCRDNSKTSTVKNAENGPWVIVGNGDVFYFFPVWAEKSPDRLNPIRENYIFGDVPSFGGASDDHNCYFSCSYNTNDSSTIYYTNNGARVDGKTSLTPGDYYTGFFIKDHTGTGGLQYASLTPSGSSSGFVSGDAGPVVFPNPVSKSIIAIPIYLLAGNCLRGTLPRLMAIPQDIDTATIYVIDKVIVDNVLTVSMHTTTSNSTTVGCFAVYLGD